jgi:hypothetical protein
LNAVFLCDDGDPSVGAAKPLSDLLITLCGVILDALSDLLRNLGAQLSQLFASLSVFLEGHRFVWSGIAPEIVKHGNVPHQPAGTVVSVGDCIVGFLWLCLNVLGNLQVKWTAKHSCHLEPPSFVA